MDGRSDRGDRFGPAEDIPRFFHSGNGRLRLTSPKSGASFSGVYRIGAGQYDPAALVSIRKIFNAPSDDPLAELSLRLIEFIDFLEDHFKPGARIEIHSGFRSPTYNARLREKGALAATASLHQYGMAADIKIQGVDSARVWRYVRKLGFGGAGYYHSDMVHVDVGPARSWDETNSGVGTDISKDNKLIGIVTDFDAYPAGDTMVLAFYPHDRLSHRRIPRVLAGKRRRGRPFRGDDHLQADLRGEGRERLSRLRRHRRDDEHPLQTARGAAAGPLCDPGLFLRQNLGGHARPDRHAGLSVGGAQPLQVGRLKALYDPGFQAAQGDGHDDDRAADDGHRAGPFAQQQQHPDRVENRFDGGDQHGFQGGHVADGQAEERIGRAHLEQPQQHQARASLWPTGPART